MAHTMQKGEIDLQEEFLSLQQLIDIGKDTLDQGELVRVGSSENALNGRRRGEYERDSYSGWMYIAKTKNMKSAEQKLLDECRGIHNVHKTSNAEAKPGHVYILIGERKYKYGDGEIHTVQDASQYELEEVVKDFKDNNEQKVRNDEYIYVGASKDAWKRSYKHQQTGKSGIMYAAQTENMNAAENKFLKQVEGLKNCLNTQFTSAKEKEKGFVYVIVGGYNPPVKIK